MAQATGGTWSMTLLDDISVFTKGSHCPKCKKKFNSWVGYYRHTARCMGMGLTSTLGVAYTYIIFLAALAVTTLLFVLMSIPVDWTYDIIMNGWMLANPSIFNQARIDNANMMMSIWALLPIVILISAIIFAIQRTLLERSPRGY